MALIPYADIVTRCRGRESHAAPAVRPPPAGEQAPAQVPRLPTPRREAPLARAADDGQAFGQKRVHVDRGAKEQGLCRDQTSLDNEIARDFRPRGSSGPSTSASQTRSVRLVLSADANERRRTAADRRPLPAHRHISFRHRHCRSAYLRDQGLGWGRALGLGRRLAHLHGWADNLHGAGLRVLVTGD